MPRSAEELRREILALVAEYHEVAFAPRELVPGESAVPVSGEGRASARCGVWRGESAVPVSGKVFGAEEVQHVVEAGLDFWLTAGRFAIEFERRFARALQGPHGAVVNCG